MGAKNLDGIAAVQGLLQRWVGGNQLVVAQELVFDQLALLDNGLFKTLVQQINPAQLLGAVQILEIDVDDKGHLVTLGEAVKSFWGAGVDGKDVHNRFLCWG